MTNEELKAAEEIYRRGCDGVPSRELGEFFQAAWVLADAMCDRLEAEEAQAAEDAMPVDEEWLDSQCISDNGDRHSDHTFHSWLMSPSNTVYAYLVVRTCYEQDHCKQSWCLLVGGTCVEFSGAIPTRGQVRKLLEALGHDRNQQGS